MPQFSNQVLTQLYEDAPFWWYLKDQALFSPVHNAESVSELDNRLNAMLNMLVQADNWGHNPAENIALDEKGGVFAHSWLGLQQQKEAIWQPVADGIDNVELSDELASALTYFKADDIKTVLSYLGHSDNPWLRRATLKYAQMQQTRLADDYLQNKIAGADEQEVLMALENIACQTSDTPYDFSAIQIESQAVEYAKARVRYCHGVEKSELVMPLARLCRSDSPFLRQALPMLFSVLSPDKVKQGVQVLLNHEALSTRLKLYAIGVAGLPAYIPQLIEYVDHPEWGPLAGEALAMITGVDIEEDDLDFIEVKFKDKVKQAQYEELQEETWLQRSKRDPQTQQYELDLPYPDVALVKPWWAKAKSCWQPLQRYIAGYAVDDVIGLQQVLQNGNQQQRLHAALYLKRLQPKQTMFNINTP